MPPEEFNPFTQNLDKVGIYKIGQKIIGATVGLMLAVGAGGVLAQTNIASVAAVQMSDGTGASSVGWTGKPQMYSSYGALMFSGNGIAFNNLYGSWTFALDANLGVAIGGAYAMQHTPPANGLIVAGQVGFGTYTPTKQLSVGANLWQADVNGIQWNNGAKTTYNGSVSGTAVWSQPFQGSAYKKFIIYLSALNDVGGTITFPTAFSHTPVIYGTAASLAICSASTTTFTIAAAATITGYVIVEGD